MNYMKQTAVEWLVEKMTQGDGNFITYNGSRLGEVVDFEKLSLKFITNFK